MKINFEKYQGAGNDFVIIDQWNAPFDLSLADISLLCNRHFGVGADGLMMLRQHPRFDFEMLYFNSDGAPGSMCGNGGRCISRMAFEKGYTKRESLFLASDGMHEAIILDDDAVKLKMKDTDNIVRMNDDYFLNTGSPHYIRCVEQLDELDVVGEGRKVRNSTEFRPDGTNVNFIMPYKDGFYVRTYERGVEDETLSCGTGVTAVALSVIGQRGDHGNHQVKIYTQGGELSVYFNFTGEGFNNVWLEGPAKKVFEGVIVL
jgi:diaminopimelate epimerase